MINMSTKIIKLNSINIRKIRKDIVAIAWQLAKRITKNKQ